MLCAFFMWGCIKGELQMFPTIKKGHIPLFKHWGFFGESLDALEIREVFLNTKWKSVRHPFHTRRRSSRWRGNWRVITYPPGAHNKNYTMQRYNVCSGWLFMTCGCCACFCLVRCYVIWFSVPWHADRAAAAGSRLHGIWNIRWWHAVSYAEGGHLLEDWRRTEWKMTGKEFMIFTFL